MSSSNEFFWAVGSFWTLTLSPQATAGSFLRHFITSINCATKHEKNEMPMEVLGICVENMGFQEFATSPFTRGIISSYYNDFVWLRLNSYKWLVWSLWLNSYLLIIRQTAQKQTLHKLRIWVTQQALPTLIGKFTDGSDSIDASLATISKTWSQICGPHRLSENLAVFYLKNYKICLSAWMMHC